ILFIVFFFSSRRRHTRFSRDWSSDVCSSDLEAQAFWEQAGGPQGARLPSTGSLQGHFQPAGSGDAAIPPDVESLPEGVNFIYRSHKAVLVQRRPEGALYLVLRTGRVDGLMAISAAAMIVLG